jgi:hypothetical protein
MQRKGETMTPNKVDRKNAIGWCALSTVIVCAIYLFLRGCGPSVQVVTGYKYDSTEKTTITDIGDTGPNAITLTGIDTFYLDNWHYSHSVDSVFTQVDTVAIINQWLNNAYRYEQTIRDSDMLIQIVDTIYRNRPIYRKVTAKNLRATRYDTTIILNTNTWHLLAGGEISINTPKPSFRIGGIYQTKKGNQYGLHYDVLQPAPNLQFGAHFKIK